MKFIDRAKIHVQAGDGGRGCVAFRREKFVPRGGPDGGDGGNGGAIRFRIRPGMSSLAPFHYKIHFHAENGKAGSGSRKHGRNGADLIIDVPPGTMIYRDEDDQLLADMTAESEEILLFAGGRGGRGNASLSSAHKISYDAQPGMEGESTWLRLELKLLADVGLVGLPNAGKSTFLSAISNARPEIADYPFTTLTPQLGVVHYNDFQSFVVADIPGLIEGAAAGKGLGHYFLRQIERTRVILHLLDPLAGEDHDALAAFDAINRELEAYDPELLKKKQLVVLTKMDVPEARQEAEQLVKRFGERHLPVFRVSAVTGEGMTPLIREVGRCLEALA